MFEINIIDFIFLSLAFMITCTGFLINNFESYLPAFVLKGFKYGCFAYQGSGGNFLDAIEISKSYYRHFYSTSTVLNAITLFYMFLVYYLEFGVNKYVWAVLRFILERQQPAGKNVIYFIYKLISKKYFHISSFKNIYGSLYWYTY